MLRRLPALFLPSALLATAALPACSEAHAEDHDRTGHLSYCELPVVCQEIVAACHTKDDVSNAEIHQCHETGHDVGTEAACGPIHDDCIAKCNAAPSLSSGDAGEPFSCADGG